MIGDSDWDADPPEPGSLAELVLRLTQFQVCPVFDRRVYELVDKEWQVERAVVLLRDAHDLGVLTYDCAFSLVAYLAHDVVMEHRLDSPRLAPIIARLDALEQEYEWADRTSWLYGQTPKEYTELSWEFERAFIAEWATLLRSFGEEELAVRLEADTDAFSDWMHEAVEDRWDDELEEEFREEEDDDVA